MVKTEIQTGVTDGKWIEVTNRRLPSGPLGDDQWVPFDSSVRVATADDLGILTDGAAVHVAEQAAAPR